MLLKSSINILLEGVPDEVDMAELKKLLLAVPGVKSLHDLHVWAVTSGKSTLTVHLVTEPEVNAEKQVLPEVRRRLAQTFGIHHITVQCELEPCGQTDEEHHFESAVAVLAEQHGEERPSSGRM
jgi:cobalt-zinc-cadmium efflux system protein